MVEPIAIEGDHYAEQGDHRAVGRARLTTAQMKRPRTSDHRVIRGLLTHTAAFLLAAAVGAVILSHYFDRGVIDAAAALEHLTGETALHPFSSQHRYHRKVFLAPPWPEIYLTDAERRHGFEAGLAEYKRLEQVFPAFGYEVIRLPKTTVPERADFVLAALAD